MSLSIKEPNAGHMNTCCAPLQVIQRVAGRYYVNLKSPTVWIGGLWGAGMIYINSTWITHIIAQNIVYSLIPHATISNFLATYFVHPVTAASLQPTVEKLAALGGFIIGGMLAFGIAVFQECRAYRRNETQLQHGN